ncbi:MAG: type II toxin-antitoxin system HicA family toxin [Patescibacteria group bacterium]
MTELAGISGKRMIRVLEKLGYQILRQKGSHVRLKHHRDPTRRPVTVPLHKELGVGLVHKMIRDAGISLESFIELL